MTTLTQSTACVKTSARRGITLLSLLALFRQRRALRHLDARALDDIGISADTARTEAARPVWDVPGHWLK